MKEKAIQNPKEIVFEREKAERAVITSKRDLEKGYEQISRILDNIRDGFYALDKEWRFTYVNRRGKEILRPLCTDPEQLIGKNIWAEFPSAAGSDWERNYHRAAREQATVEFETRFEPLHAWFEVRVYPSADGLSVYFLDITARKRTEADRNLRADTLAAVVESSDDAIISMGLDTIISTWNRGAERTFGYAAAEVIGRPINILIPKGREDEEPRILERLVLGERIEHYETVRVRKDGKLLNVSLTVSPIHDGEHRIVGVSKISRDVTAQKKADAALRESEERFRAIVEATPECVKVVAPDGTLLAMNVAGCGMVEANCDAEVVGKNIYDVIAPEFREQFAEFNRKICGGTAGQFDFRLVGLKGTQRWMETHAVPMRDPASGKTVQLAVTRDVTARKEAEEKLRQSEEDLRALANSISQLAWMAHPDGYIFWYNHRWYEYTGATPEQMEGWGWESVHDPAMLDEVKRRWQESIDTGKPFEMEFQLRGADGQFRWYLTRVNPMRDPNGQVVRWFGTNTDVDEVRRMQLALKEESRFLELLNETGKAIASKLDLDDVVQLITDSATNLSGAKFGAFFYNVINQQGEAYLLYKMSGAPPEAFDQLGHPRATPVFGPTFRGEGPVRSSDITKDPRYGQWAPHHGMPPGHLPVRSYLAVSVVSRSGKVIGGLFFGHPEPDIFTDRAERLVVGVAAQAAVAIDNARLYDAAQGEISRRKKVEEELRAVQERLRSHADDLEGQVSERTAKLREKIGELEAFSYSVSHDMRSPLRAMHGYADALLEDYASKLDATGEDYLNRIKRSALRMDLLIQDVLAYSRVAQGEVALQEIDLASVISDVIDNYPSLKAERARIVVPESFPKVLGHEAYLTQTVSNILTNGVKFVAEGTFPQIQISTSIEGDLAEVSFQDNGIGIAAEHRQRIFQIFGRVYSDKQYEGTGIGLAIAKKAVERMGGSIGVHSELGKGSRFFIRLKRA